ncbi:hypothetical protein [Aestuariivirga sp.]|jgi:hypothetical protein|uniref:hypothetical protein n=1 Tax=Aestuariivirga sp. TaxID=2650926 RepID=UPI0037850F86
MSVGTFVKILAATASILTSCAAYAFAQDAPNLIGTWSGKIVHGARFGALNHDPAENDPVFADRKKEWTLVIDKQDGSGLIGTWSTKAKTERLVGVIRQDNVTVVFADEDNLFDAQLLSTSEMELCAQEGAAAKGGATIAVCYLMKRK